MSCKSELSEIEYTKYLANITGIQKSLAVLAERLIGKPQDKKTLALVYGDIVAYLIECQLNKRIPSLIHIPSNVSYDVYKGQVIIKFSDILLNFLTDDGEIILDDMAESYL